jgi:hypothetical protein
MLKVCAGESARRSAHPLAAMGLLWALEKGYYAATMYWRIRRPSVAEYKLRGISLLSILQERGENSDA